AAGCPVLTLAGNAHARPVADAGGNSDVHCSRMTVLLDRETARGAFVRVLEIELNLVLEVAPPAGPLTARPPRACVRAGHRSTEDRLEEVREGVGAPEHLLHFLLGHRPVAAAGSAAEGFRSGRPAAGARAGTCLLVHAPVGAQLVVLLPLLGITEYF